MRVVLGTGLIGAGLAQGARARGESVRVFNRTPARAEALRADGCEVAYDPAAAVQGATTVHLALTADAAVDAVLGAILDHVPPSAVVVDHSTTSPEGAAARLARCTAAGVAFLHAPVFMNPDACRASAGVMVVCGPASAWARAEASLRPMTGTVLYVGEEGHLAATYKLAGNGMILTMLAGLADVLTLGHAQGIDPSTLVRLFDAFDVRGVIAGRGARMAAGDDTVAWSLAMARKDQGLMVQAARGRALAVLPAVGARMDALIDAGHAEADVGVLARDVRVETTPSPEPSEA